MIKASFLKSLKGLDLAEANKRCQAAGHIVEEIPFGNSIMLQSRPNTVLLWHRDNVVYVAGSGNLDSYQDRSSECKCSCHTGGLKHAVACSCYSGEPVIDKKED